MSRLSRPRRRAVVAAAVACLGLTACSPQGEQPAGDTGDQGAFPRTIEHAMGETTIEERPETVVALDSSFADAAAALETEVVAYTRYPTSDSVPEYLGDDARYVEGGREVGELATPDIEALYEIDADLIVSAKVRHDETVYDQLPPDVPAVFSETTGATWKDNIRLLAEALGKEELAEQKIDDYERRAAEIGDAIREKTGGTPTYSLVRFVEGEQTVRLYTTNSFGGIVLSDVGLARPEGQPDSDSEILVEVSQEEIGKLDADRIFVSTYEDDTTEATSPKETFQGNPLWGTLEGTVHQVPDKTWYVSVSLQGAHAMLDDLAEQFGVDPARA
ncbi:ABC transporter substrate-binding protein [Saccharomonospora iraqiensis]|uniref:ABC transporter substrate-binding protein n=1 Tax=Saccharomonospora iraqiensis TaxID=52698 RepID=UPI00022DF910|nr:ABC transporter substrate-binding protein [Saccharomonospora iraqiensis]